MSHLSPATPDGSSWTLISKHRIEALADGLFAIVMTLLVLELRVPDLPRTASTHEILHELAPLWRVLFSFLITFMLASVYWLFQQTIFNATRTLDKASTFLHLAALMFVALFPFSTAMLGHYLTNRLAMGIYFGNQFAVALMLALSWTNVRRRHNLHPLEPGMETRITARIYTLPLACLAAAVFGFISPHAAFYGFLIVILASRVYQKRILKI